MFLDTGVLSSVIFPSGQENKECIAWLRSLIAAGVRVCIPEISDYEVRRKLLHRRATKQLGRLDSLKSNMHYVPIDTAAMQKAAELWAQGRSQGRPTADDKSLDADVILSAQAQLSLQPGDVLMVATTDVGDLSTFVPASRWRGISP